MVHLPSPGLCEGPRNRAPHHVNLCALCAIPHRGDRHSRSAPRSGVRRGDTRPGGGGSRHRSRERSRLRVPQTAGSSCVTSRPRRSAPRGDRDRFVTHSSNAGGTGLGFPRPGALGLTSAVLGLSSSTCRSSAVPVAVARAHCRPSRSEPEQATRPAGSGKAVSTWPSTSRAVRGAHPVRAPGEGAAAEPAGQRLQHRVCGTGALRRAGGGRAAVRREEFLEHRLIAPSANGPAADAVRRQRGPPVSGDVAAGDGADHHELLDLLGALEDVVDLGTGTPPPAARSRIGLLNSQNYVCRSWSSLDVREPATEQRRNRARTKTINPAADLPRGSDHSP